jgi:hypothetical protein
MFAAHSAYAAISELQRVPFSFRGQLHEAFGKAPLQQFWVFRGEVRVVRNEAPRFVECRRKCLDGFRPERIIRAHRLGASTAQITRPTQWMC